MQLSGRSSDFTTAVAVPLWLERFLAQLFVLTYAHFSLSSLLFETPYSIGEPLWCNGLTCLLLTVFGSCEFNSPT